MAFPADLICLLKKNEPSNYQQIQEEKDRKQEQTLEEKGVEEQKQEESLSKSKSREQEHKDYANQKVEENQEVRKCIENVGGK